MSQLTYPRIQLHSLNRRLRIWLSVAAVAVAAAIPTVLVISDDDSVQTHKSAAPAAGLRYDGGPDEGTRGQVGPPAGTRYDGGPDESSHGVIDQRSPVVTKPVGDQQSGARP